MTDPAQRTDWSATTSLLPHQREALAKLLPARVGALFAEMGTGKTRIAIELARLRRAKITTVFWFCPVSAKETIRREILKHTDTCQKDIYVFDAKTSEHLLPAARWYIVGTESVGGSARVYLTAAAAIDESSMVVLDESHQIKGHRAKRTERLTHICARARYRLILTGTPISQGIVDLFAQMRFLSAKILGYRSFYTFARNHLVYSERFKGMIERERNKDYLAARIQPYVYQVTKRECMTLPPKLYEARYCTLTYEQRRAYETAKREALEDQYLLGEEWERSIAIFRLFTRLQSVVCGFESAGDGDAVALEHNRIDALMATIAAIHPSAPIVIWAKYHFAMQQIVEAIESQHGAESVCQYHGRLSERKRQESLDRWRSGQRFLVATQSAGGQSIDLTYSSHSIYYANGFKYAERQQSEDRQHRLGQSLPVTYVDIWSNANIDDRIETALSRKGNAVSAFQAEVQKIRKTNKDRLRKLVQAL